MSYLILYNANVLTMDVKNPKAEAVGIIDDKISFVGRDGEYPPQSPLIPPLPPLKKGGWGGINGVVHAPSIKYVDLKGKTVVPGFIDSHVHFLQRGLQLFELDLQDTCSIDDALSKLNIKIREIEKGKWITGFGWDESKWKDRRFITKRDIDKVAPENPVVLKRICMHLWVLNSRAIEILKANSSISKQASVEEINLQTGHLNVSLRTDVKEILKGCFNPSEDELQNALLRAQSEAVRLGITSVHDMTPYLDILTRVNEKGELFVRNYACPSLDCGLGSADCGKTLGKYFNSAFRIPHSDILRIGCVKIFADGSFGTRTAALMEPYADDEGNRGMLICGQKELDDTVARIHSMGEQIAIHAIGDRAIAAALDAFEKAIKVNPRLDHRHRIEHCELVDNKLISRIRDLNIVVSAQPNFIGQWGNKGGLYEKRLGKERWHRINPLAQFKRKGIHVAFGSDGMPFGPMYGIWSCVNHPVVENRLSPDDAIRYYTYGGAYASFDEAKKGTIEVGKLADIVVLSDDITSIPQSDIKNIKVIMTIIGGKVRLDTEGLLSHSGNL